jgi:hypothetical protein
MPRARVRTLFAFATLVFVSVASLSACGRLSIAPRPTRSCASRGCDRAAEAAAEALGCEPGRTLVRDLGVDRYRATGCGQTVVLDCAHGCRADAPPARLAPRDEVAYRASFELLCAPESVAIEETEGGAFVAACRGVSVRYLCERGCERGAPVDPGRFALRALEPEVLDCVSRSHIELRVAFDEAGEVVRVDGDGLRTVRIRGREAHRDSVETRGDCLRAVFAGLASQPSLAGTDEVFEYGGPEARSPAQLSRLAPPHASSPDH